MMFITFSHPSQYTIWTSKRMWGRIVESTDLLYSPSLRSLYTSTDVSDIARVTYAVNRTRRILIQGVELWTSRIVVKWRAWTRDTSEYRQPSSPSLVWYCRSVSAWCQQGHVGIFSTSCSLCTRFTRGLQPQKWWISRTLIVRELGRAVRDKLRILKWSRLQFSNWIWLERHSWSFTRSGMV